MNLSYVLWVMAESFFLLAMYCVIQVVSYVVNPMYVNHDAIFDLSSLVLSLLRDDNRMLPRTPLLFKGVSHNQLFIFFVVRDSKQHPHIRI